MARNEDTPQEGNDRARDNSRGGERKVFGRGTRFDRPEGGNREGGFRNRERDSDRPSSGDRDRSERPRREDDRDGDINTNRENRERAPRRENDRRPGDFRPARGFERPDRGNDRPDFRPRGENDRSDRRPAREGGFNREGRDDRRGSGSFQDRREGSRGPARGGEERGGERRSFGNRDDRGGERRGTDRPSFGGNREDNRGARGGDRREGGFQKPGFSSDRNDRGFNRGGDDRRERGGDREERTFNRGGDRREDRGFNREDRRSDTPRENRPFSGNRPENGTDRPARREGDRPYDRNAPRENRGREDRSSSFQRRDDRPERGTSRPDRNDRNDRNDRSGRGDSKGFKEGRFGRSDEEVQEAPFYNLKRYEERRKKRDDSYGNEDLRLNRYIANAGICSRREADELIAAGEIKVNGQVVTEMGYKVAPTDTVQYGRKTLSREKTVYVLLNKPKDFLTTTDDPEGRKTVMDLVKNASKERLFPVGRLDRNTTGLLLFTNDGELAQKLTHPSNKISKIYQVELDKPITQEHVKQIQEGLMLEDGKAEVDEVALLGESNKFLGIEIHIGRNRIVRRIFEHLGYDVVTLDRVQYAGLTKKDLPRGNWRFLSEKEVVRLKYFM
ncbi:pseudouridine synthase [Rufibacter sediminis]|uniref:Pseudouridine synthase n=1 Tax=Rufibacter sediminis TaxID=2762756 RepID=A0ABR6VQU7_9BACT|nr:pseudouridine synthase [Rufibacter sediminis]MBC3539530.1 pseudouridine synthase [Rufibacter sediminis]